jgi:hypothetical protein
MSGMEVDRELIMEVDRKLIMAIANYSDFLTQEDMSYLPDLIRTKQYVTLDTHINIMNKLLLLAEHKYMLDSAIIASLKTTNNIYEIHVMIDRHIKLKLEESAIDSAIFTPEELSILKELDTYTFGIELRKALLEHSDYGKQLPVKIKNYLETIDPYIVLAFIDKLFSSSSEGIDIVIQPICNVFGFLHNGDLHPLYKMVIELMLIGELTNDDKSDKRQIRLNFLSACIEIPDFLKLYYSMYLYLNCIQKGQTIALIVSGGNLVTLFAKLLNDISIKSSFELLIDKHKDILTEFLEYYPDPTRYFDEETLLLHLKRQVTPILAESIPTVAAMLFGDIDFKLIKVIKLKYYEFTTKKKLYHDFRLKATSAGVFSDAQFFLGREKIIKYIGPLNSDIRNKLKIYRKQYAQWLKDSCYRVVDMHGNGEVLKKKLDREILDNIFPSQMQDQYLKLLSDLKKTLSDPYSIISIDNCYKYLLFLSSRKVMNELGTRDNIDKISKNGNTSEFIKALRYYTTKGNSFIVSQDYRIGLFKTFDFVMTDKIGTLPKLVASLLNLFLNDTDEDHSNFVLDYQPIQLEASKVTYDYTKTKNHKSYESIMGECEAIIELHKPGYHIVFLGLDATNGKGVTFSMDKPSNSKSTKLLTKTIDKSSSTKKSGSYVSTKNFRDYVSSLLFSGQKLIPGVSVEIVPDDSVHEFNRSVFIDNDTPLFDNDNPFLPENFFDFDLTEWVMSLPGEGDAEGDRYTASLDEPMFIGGFNNNLVKSKKHKSKKPKKSRKSKPQKSRKHKPKKPKKSRKYKPQKSRKLRY